jgi:hypothetical protein
MSEVEITVVTREDARKVLADRYGWEIDAIAQDVLNKGEMAILTTREAIIEYLSNLLVSHPRTRESDLAAETLLASHNRSLQTAPTLLLAWEGEQGLQERAYCVMGVDIEQKLSAAGLQLSEG